MKKKYNFPVLYLEATRRCNLACPACMTGSNNKDYVQKMVKDELTYTEIIQGILKPGLKLGFKQVYFSGGEFLMREDALSLVKAAVDLGLSPKIATNGILVNEDLIKELKNIAGRDIVLAFGINSISNEMISEKSRNVDLKFIKEKLDLCKKHKLSRHVVVTVAKFNRNEFEETLNWLEDNHIPFNRVPFVPRNSGKKFNKFSINKDDMENCFHPFLNKRVNGYFSFTPFFLSPELHEKYSGGKHNVSVVQNPSIGCWVGSWLAISAEGGVSPCTILLDEVIAGNIREKSLYDIIDKSEVFNNILDRSKLKGKCGICRYQSTCGGCRGLAYYSSGDYMAEDPTCFFEPDDNHSKSIHEEQTNKIFKKYLRVARFANMYEPNKEIS